MESPARSLICAAPPVLGAPASLACAGDGGVVDGMGSVWWQRARAKQLNFSRGPLMQFLWSTDVIVANITLLNSSYWAVHPVYSRSVWRAGTLNAPLRTGLLHSGFRLVHAHIYGLVRSAYVALAG